MVNRFVHLSVNPAGRLSLWDTDRSALSGKESGEMYVLLQLTDEQLALLNDIASRARPPRRPCQ